MTVFSDTGMLVTVGGMVMGFAFSIFIRESILEYLGP